MDIKNISIKIEDVKNYDRADGFLIHWVTFSVPFENKELLYKLTLGSYNHRPYEAIIDHVSQRKDCPYCEGMTPFDNECWGFNEKIDDIIEKIKRHPPVRLYLLFENSTF